jgi:hypothetical protein
MQFAARRCLVCAYDRVERNMWWIGFANSWLYVGTWCALNSRGVFAISQSRSQQPQQPQE